MIVLALSAMMFVGCGGDDGDDEKTDNPINNPGNNPGGNEGRDNKLVTGDGEAWVMCDGSEDYECAGYILKSNGEAIVIAKVNDTWYYYIVDYYDDYIGTWSTSGNQLTISIVGAAPYSVSANGNQLTITMSATSQLILTKTSGIYPVNHP